jgi:SAM-dependent methyltransferase
MTSGDVVYETIGRTYAVTRREDPRIAARIHAGLGDARRVVNVGAGTGNYEPADRTVVALEPSAVMLAQRDPSRSGLVTCGFAEALPFPDRAFDASLCVLTVHHWADLEAGLAELRRVAPRQVVFFYEPAESHRFWAIDYFPTAIQVPSEANAPGEERLRAGLDVRDVQVVPVPADCIDGFGAAYWRRPEGYLDPAVHQGQSWLARLPPDELAAGADQLRADLDSGAWAERYGHLLELDEYDAGYRLAVAGG